MERAVQTKMLEIEQGMKKNEIKLKNMKKKTMILKDKQEERKSSKLIQYNRSRRSKSRSRISSPKNQTKSKSKSRSIIQEQNQKNK